MTLSATTTFDVTDASVESAEVSIPVQPPVGAGAGRGRLVHPALGTYDYEHAPGETVDLDGDVIFRPAWSRATTLGGAVDALWSGVLRDAVVIERWGAGLASGDVGCPLAQLRMLQAFFAAPPAPGGPAVIWTPNYANARSYRVVLADVRAGGERYTLDRWLAARGYAPKPVELELRVLGYA